jgi:hypothetical protein
MNIFKRNPKKPQFIIEHENRLASYAESVNKEQEEIYENGIISHKNLYMFSVFHYWYAFSTFYIKLRTNCPLEMIPYEEAVKKNSVIHNNRINNISNSLMNQYEDAPVSAKANGNLKLLLQDLTQYSLVSLDDDLNGTIDVLTLIK